MVPVPKGGLVILIVFKTCSICLIRLVGKVLSRESQDILIGSEFEVVTITCFECGFAFPQDADIVGGAVKRALNQCRMLVLSNDSGVVAFWFGPVITVIGMFPCRIRKPKCNSGSVIS